MKRILTLILCLLLLCGCGVPADTDTTSTEGTPTVTESPTEPAGLYESGNELETLTGGAVKAYPLNRSDTQRVIPFGSDLLLLSADDTTTMTKLTGANLHIAASITLDCFLYPGDPSVRASEKGVTYFDPVQCDLVFLDASLKEVSRFPVPTEIIGQPALSADRKHLYYLTADALRAINLDSGIDRLVKQMAYDHQSVSRLHCGDTVLECEIGDDSGAWHQVFLDVSTGQLLAESEVYLYLETTRDRYFTTRMDGDYQEALTGTGASDIQMLHYPNHQVMCFPVLEQNLIITADEAQDTVTLDCYRLEDGTRPYSLTLPGEYAPWLVIPASTGNSVWMLTYSQAHCSDLLLRWDYEASPVEDDTVYIGNRRTADHPDEFGLAECADLAKQLSAKHGIQILIWTDATETQPRDYSFVPEHQVPLIRDALTRLDGALSHFPADFLREAVSEMGDGTLRIGLVRTFSGLAGFDALEEAGGLQFWEDQTQNPYVILRVSNEMEQHLYHELFHIIESRIFSLSKALDDWEKLNPPGFSYDYSYLYYTAREDYHLTGGDTQAFIDLYSMTFPKEDRARIMEYAMMEGNEGCFTSDIMQQKLRAICKGIREAYDLEDFDESFLWEQYLKEPIRKK